MANLFRCQMLQTFFGLVNLWSCTLEPSQYSDYIKKYINTATGEWADRVEMNAADSGTHNTKQHNWPWLVALTRTYDNKQTYFCSGVLLQSNVVLTAAHCIHDKPKIKNISRHGQVRCIIKYQTGFIQEHFRVLAGYTALDANTQLSCEKSEPGQFQVRRVEAAVSHPTYPSTGCIDTLDSSYVDLAILKLSNRLDENEFVRPICRYAQSHVSGLDPKSACNAFAVAGFGPTTSQRLKGMPKGGYQYAFSSEWAAIKLYNDFIEKEFKFAQAQYIGRALVPIGIHRKTGQYHQYFAPVSAADYMKEYIARTRQQVSCADLLNEYPTDIPSKCCVGPGWSGSPVMFVRNNTWYLYGIISSGITQTAVGLPVPEPLISSLRGFTSIGTPISRL